MLDDDDMSHGPSRTIHRRGYQKKVNRQLSLKANALVDTESALESIILIAADLDPRVCRVYPQPCTFELNTGESFPTQKALNDAVGGSDYKPWKYTPDFLFELVDGSRIFVEGKHTRLIEKDPDFRKVPVAMVALGHRHTVVTERFFSRAFERNLRTLKTAPRGYLNDDQRAWLLDDCPSCLTFREIEGLGFDRNSVHAAIRDGYLCAPLERAPFNDQTVLSPTGGDTSYLEVLPL
ncbi:hypothetical protein [Pseudooceanicola sp.]|uniref:hypothetical protein n=1 Tax=Pseudooceanicola sp. TaxID=1914328 RepID=UPI0035C724D5